MDFGDSRAAMITVFDLLWTIAFPVAVAYPVVTIIHARAVRGTRLRYVMASVLPIIYLVSLAMWSVRVVLDVLLERAWWQIGVDALMVMLWLFIWRQWTKNRDDEDFWKGLGGRIRKRLARARLLPAPAAS